MDAEAKKGLYFLLPIPFLYIVLMVAIMYTADGGSPIVMAVCGVAVMLAVVFLMRRFLLAVPFGSKGSYAPFRTVRFTGSDSGDTYRRIEITVSKNVSRGRTRLAVDGKEIADAEGGERLRMELSSGRHTFSAGVPPGVECEIPAEGDCGFYVWYNRNDAKNMLRVEDVTEGIGAAEAADNAVFARSRRMIEIFCIAGMIMSVAIIIAFALLMSVT